MTIVRRQAKGDTCIPWSTSIYYCAQAKSDALKQCSFSNECCVHSKSYKGIPHPRMIERCVEATTNASSPKLLIEDKKNELGCAEPHIWLSF